MIAIFEPELIRMFRKFDPIDKYIMSKKDGKLNPLFTIDKGQLSDLYYFATFEEEEGLDNPDYNKLMQMVEEKKKNRIILPN